MGGRHPAGPRDLRARRHRRKDGARGLPSRWPQVALGLQVPDSRDDRSNRTGQKGSSSQEEGGLPMKAKDLRERTGEDLSELEKSLAKDTFTHRFKNFTNRLDDTSLIGKTRRDLARVK